MSGHWIQPDILTQLRCRLSIVRLMRESRQSRRLGQRCDLWLLSKLLYVLAVQTSITQLLRFNYQRRGSTGHMHSGRTLSRISVPVLLQNDLEGHMEEQIRCRPTVKLLKAVRIGPSHMTRKHNTDAAATAAEPVWQILIRTRRVSHAEALRWTQRV